MIIWVTGISGAGKTTVCDAIWSKIKPQLPQLAVIDGDVVRQIFGGSLGHREVDRVVQIKRIQSIAKLLDDQGFIVLVAALYSHPDLLNWNRENFEEYYEVYLDVSLEMVQQRDPKGLYAKAAAGKMPHVVGIDIPWHAPKNPHLVFDGNEGETVETIAEKIILGAELRERARS
ncbi:MAG: adenylyl-sulfate kinase [Rhodospirillales bacterium]|nr:adenylyl-sulfate kinase [Rhodospirillales bacterium]